MRNEKYVFGFSIEGGKEMLDCSGPWVQNFVDIQMECGAPYGTKDKDLLVDVTTAIMDKYYANTKKGFGEKEHQQWADMSLSDKQVEYAGKDMYAASEIWTRIVNFNKSLLRMEEEKKKRCTSWVR